MIDIEDFIYYLKEQVANGSIYLNGGQGQYVYKLNYDYIHKKEHGDKDNIRRVYDKIFYNKKLYDVSKMRCFDCSGLLMYYLQTSTGIVKRDYNCNGIFYELCDSKLIDRDEIQKGDILFKLNGQRATHCAVAIDEDFCIEARGRDYGVVMSLIDNRNFDIIKRLKCTIPKEKSCFLTKLFE